MQAVSIELARQLRNWPADKADGEPAFAQMPAVVACILQVDLDAARVAWIADANDDAVWEQCDPIPWRTAMRLMKC